MAVNWGIQQFQPRTQLDLSPLVNQINLLGQQKRQRRLDDLTLSAMEAKQRGELKKSEIIANATGPDGQMNRNYITSEFARNGLTEELKDLETTWSRQDEDAFNKRKEQAALRKEHNERWGQLSGGTLSSVDIPGAYKGMRKTAIDEGLTGADQLPEEYNEQIGGQLQNWYRNSLKPAELEKYQEYEKAKKDEFLNSEFQKIILPQIDVKRLQKPNYKNEIIMIINSSPYWNTPLAKQTIKALKGEGAGLGDAIAKAIAIQGVQGKNRPLPATQAEELGGTEDAIMSLRKLKGVLPEIGGAGVFTPITDPIGGLNPWNTRLQAKQQYIATVKQVIGKGLEGGVLRKEDEAKYDKIIPRMGDLDDVFVKKADQLEEALLNKRKFMISGLGSAGFDVGGFEDLSIKKEGLADAPPKTADQIIYERDNITDDDLEGF